MHRLRKTVVVLASLAACGFAASLWAQNASGDERVYIVQLSEPPVLARRDSRPWQRRKQRRTLAQSADLSRQVQRLSDSHDRLLGRMGAYHRKVYSYGYTFNGFAARLTPAQAERLRVKRGVAAVWEDHLRHVATADSPAFLGLTNPTDGLRSGLGLTGENVVIGIIDSGIAPNHPSLVDRVEKEPPRVCRSSWADSTLLGAWLCARFDDQIEVLFSPLADWTRVCQTGEGFTFADCNNKIVSARFYREGFDALTERDVNEFVSPRDADGHGTHIASIAAGNAVEANLFGHELGRIEGMAPQARIAVYKACWLEPGAFRASCSIADLQRAIEDAVADGVDIINYSIGDPNDSFDDPDDIALLAAADAGIFSVVAAGNEGPTPGTIMSPGSSPWVLTVGGSTRAGTKFEEGIRVNTPAALAGTYASREASFTPGLATTGPMTGSLALVDDGVLGFDENGNIGTTYDACEPLRNSRAVQGKIAFIQRGICTFQEKVQNAQVAGALAAVVFNNQGDPILMGGQGGLVTIPAVMIGEADGTLFRDRIQAGDIIEVTLDKALLFGVAEVGDVMGSFSGRGPNGLEPKFLKPDVIAPGVNILGGHSPDVANGIRGEQFQYLSGTSQAVPHVAGVAALLRQAHPDWSPAAIKSALMTTARQNILKEDRQTQADSFDMGAGHIVPNLATDPGLVYETTTEGFDAYLCGMPTPRLSDSECAALLAGSLTSDGKQLNLPSIAVAGLGASVTVTRTVTNVGDAAQYTAQWAAPAGIGVAVVPGVLSLDTGESASFEVRFTNLGAEPDTWYHGSVVWQNATHQVRSPFVVHTVALLAPAQVDGSDITGSIQIPLEFGYDGSYQVQVHGLRPACVLPASVADLELGCQNPGTVFIADDLNNAYELFDPAALPDYIRRIEFDVPADRRLLRISLFQRFVDNGNGNDDLDIIVYRCTELLDPTAACTRFEFLDQGILPLSSDEQVDLPFPVAGRYVVDIHGYETDEVNGGPGANTSLYVWAFGDNDNQGNLLIGEAPVSVSAGSTATLTADWNGLAPALYLGGVSHIGRDGNGDLITTDQNGDVQITLIDIDATQPTSTP